MVRPKSHFLSIHNVWWSSRRHTNGSMPAFGSMKRGRSFPEISPAFKYRNPPTRMFLCLRRAWGSPSVTFTKRNSMILQARFRGTLLYCFASRGCQKFGVELWCYLSRSYWTSLGMPTRGRGMRNFACILVNTTD